MQQALDHLRTADPVMAGLIDSIGPYSIEFLQPTFQTLVKAIVLQQLSGKVADVIFGRVVALCGNGCLTPEGVLKRRMSTLRSTGLSKQKAEYIRELARQVRNGTLDLAALHDASDEEVHRVLTSLKGIGPWTVHMFLMFALRRPDVLAPADLGIQVAIQKAYGLDQRPTPKQVQELGAKWTPFRTVACWYLWRSLEAKAGM